MKNCSTLAAAFGGGFWPCLDAGGGAVFLSTRLGANFLPYLDEGWLVVEVQRDPQISLAKSVDMELQTERAIRAAVPEVKDLYSRIGMSEIATDPQGANQNDIYISFRPRAEWRKSTGTESPNPNWANHQVGDRTQRARPGIGA
jgi:heavy metal efflux system protein